MISVLISVVGTSAEGSVLQQSAASCLAEVARAASLLSASAHRDILLPVVKGLLEGLFMASVCVREFSLKVSERFESHWYQNNSKSIQVSYV